MSERPAQIIVALMLAAGVLTGCAGPDTGGPEADTGGARAVRSTPAIRTIPFDLLTHCGIDEARIGSTYFEAETPLSNGSGSPPEG